MIENEDKLPNNSSKNDGFKKISNFENMYLKLSSILNNYLRLYY